MTKEQEEEHDMNEYWYGLLEGVVFAICCALVVVALVMIAP